MEEATSILAGFHAGSLSCSNWNLEMLVFVDKRKNGEPGEKPSEQGEKQQQTGSTYGTELESKPNHISWRQALLLLRYPCLPFPKRMENGILSPFSWDITSTSRHCDPYGVLSYVISSWASKLICSVIVLSYL